MFLLSPALSHSPLLLSTQSLEGKIGAAAAETDRLGDAAAHTAGVLVASLEAEVARRE